MRNVLQIVIVLAIVLLAAGIFVAFMAKVKADATRIECTNRLRQLAVALHSYHSVYGHFPTGTHSNPGLPPEKRLSWAVEMYPYYLMGGIGSRLDRKKAWDDPKNCPPIFVYRDTDWVEHLETEPRIGCELNAFCCPGLPFEPDYSQPAPLHYVGIAGVGADAARLSLPHPRAGAFGYDRKVGEKEITDGLSTTLLLAEAADGGPWTAGGPATVRPLEPDRQPYLGPSRSFASPHRDTGWFTRQYSNVLMADGTARMISASIAPEVFEALATIAGGEDVDPFTN
jgi:hypothetical protein